jgi:metal-responsive CopG/Arc/MetJ family transcriptional regulator
MPRKQQWNIEVDDQLYKQLEDYLQNHPLEVRSRLIRELVKDFLRHQPSKTSLKSSSWQQMGIDSFPEPRAELAREDC